MSNSLFVKILGSDNNLTRATLLRLVISYNEIKAKKGIKTESEMVEYIYKVLKGAAKLDDSYQYIDYQNRWDDCKGVCSEWK